MLDLVTRPSALRRALDARLGLDVTEADSRRVFAAFRRSLMREYERRAARGARR